jgi:hypothetical protein
MLADLFRSRERVLDRIVKDRGDDRLVVESQVGQDSGDLDRMAVIGVAGGAGLAAMCLHRKDIGAVDQRLVGVRVIALDLLDQFILPQHPTKMGCCAMSMQPKTRLGGLWGEISPPANVSSPLAGAAVAALQFLGGEGAALDAEAPQGTDLPHQRGTDDRGPAGGARRGAARFAAAPDIVAGDEALLRRRRCRLGCIIAGGQGG